MNNPFEESNNNSNPFEPKEQRHNIKMFRNTIVTVLVLIIIGGIIFGTFGSTTNISKISTQEELTDTQTVDLNGTQAVLDSSTATSCKDEQENCQQFNIGEQYQSGIYTVTIDFNFESISELVNDTNKYSDLPYIEFTTSLDNYFGLKRDSDESDYYDFFLVDEDPIYLQNVPLLGDSAIYMFDNTDDLDIKISLEPQSEYYIYDNQNPKAGFYLSDVGIGLGSYQIDGYSAQKYNTEYVPTSYDSYTFFELLDLYHENGDDIVVKKNSMIVVYDDGIYLK